MVLLNDMGYEDRLGNEVQATKVWLENATTLDANFKKFIQFWCAKF